MRYIGIALLAAALLGVSAPSKNVTIVVNGEGTIGRSPDVATISMGIVSTDPVAQKATTDNNSRYNDVRNRLHSIGIADSAIRTLSYNLNYEQPQPPEPGTARPILGRPASGQGGTFTVSRQVEVRLTKLDQVGEVVDQVVGANVSNVYNVGYSISNYREVYAQALKAAVSDAQLQAKAMASAAGMHIVRVSAMQSGGFYPRPMMMKAIAAPQSAGVRIPTELPPSSMDVQANVTVTYVIAP
ncbi:MAG: SIMPL domain-containing protein [Candidatus Eremiobacteraeota bacterium]|nr:SIMPL domain-containing protein [Candidatus Eremiobacteraeota bacterium]